MHNLPLRGLSPHPGTGVTIIHTARPGNGTRLSAPSADAGPSLASTYGVPGAGEHRVERRVAAILGSYQDMMLNLSNHWQDHFTRASEEQEERAAASYKEWAKFQDKMEEAMEKLFAKHEKHSNDFGTMTEKLYAKHEVKTDNLFSQQERILNRIAGEIDSHHRKIREQVKEDVADGLSQHKTMITGMINSQLSPLNESIISMRNDLHYIKSSEESIRQVTSRAQTIDKTMEQIQSLPNRVQDALERLEKHVQKVHQTFELSSAHLDELPKTLSSVTRASDACKKIVSSCYDGGEDSEDGFLAQLKRCHNQLVNSVGFKELSKFDSLFAKVYQELQNLSPSFETTPQDKPSVLLADLMKSIKEVSKLCEKTSSDLGKDKDSGLISCISQCSTTFMEISKLTDRDDFLKTLKDVFTNMKELGKQMGDDPLQLLQPIKKVTQGCADVTKACNGIMEAHPDLLDNMQKSTRSLALIMKADEKVKDFEETLIEAQRDVIKMNKECSDTACANIHGAVKGCQQILKVAEFANDDVIGRLREINNKLDRPIWNDLEAMTKTLEQTKREAEKLLTQLTTNLSSNLRDEFRKTVDESISKQIDTCSQRFGQQLENISTNADLAVKRIQDMIAKAELSDLLGLAVGKVEKMLSNTHVHVDTFEAKMVTHGQQFESKMADQVGTFQKKVEEVGTTIHDMEASLTTSVAGVVTMITKKVEPAVDRIETNVTKMDTHVEKMDKTLDVVEQTVQRVLRWGKGAVGVAAGGLTSGLLTLAGILQRPRD